MGDQYRLERFLDAQDEHYEDDISYYEAAISELRAGRKIGHWMWFVFPQVTGLGYSSMTQIYAISSLTEAQAYLRHPALGTRLMKCAQILIDINGKSATEIFGSTDAMKLRSSMTLFMTAAPDEPVFREVLVKYFHGSPDQNTIDQLHLI